MHNVRHNVNIHRKNAKRTLTLCNNERHTEWKINIMKSLKRDFIGSKLQNVH